ncbi:MAG: general transcription repressor [Bathelium mastoideum]|nr:MAG: general transcription repressor [Bathelium mastoideum]
MIAAYVGGKVLVWDLTTRTRRHRYLVEAFVSSTAFSPDGEYIAAGCVNNTFYIWDISTGSLCQTLKDESDDTISTASIAFAPDGQSLFTSSLGMSIKRWDLRNLHAGRQVAEIRCMQTFSSGNISWLSTAIMSDRVYLFSGTSERVQVWDPLTGQAKLYLKAHDDSSEYGKAQARV